MAASSNRRTKLAEEVVNRTIGSLPEELRKSAQTVPVTYCRWPSAELVIDGIADDTLGLFVGCEWVDHTDGNNPNPPAILLFLENIWDATERDESDYQEEVRITYLHELGHYLGLDEDDLEERGLG